MARRLTASPLPAWVGDLPVFERTLANGLKAPRAAQGKRPTVVVCDLYYPGGVGPTSRPGRPGQRTSSSTCCSRGRPGLPEGADPDRLDLHARRGSNRTQRQGEDFTHYWFAFPAGRWELAAWRSRPTA